MNRHQIICVWLICALLALIACSSSSTTAVTSSSSTSTSSSSAKPYWNTAISYGTLQDTRDSQSYRTVTIGSQTWMAQNLNYAPTNGVYGCYKDSTQYCVLYGKLYDWATADSACPLGWHLPDTTEWDSLEASVGGASIAGSKLKAMSGWTTADSGITNTDDYGFSALPAGYFTTAFFHAKDIGYWWTASDSASDNAYYRGLYYNTQVLKAINSFQTFAFSVRCVKNK